MHVIASRTFASLALFAGLLEAQTEYGTVQLPANLADPGVKVLGVLNKNPTTNVNFAYCEGPTTDSAGNLFFAQFDPNNDLNSTIWKVPPTGAATVFYASGEGSNGMEFDPLGRLVVCQNMAVRRVNPGGTTTTLAANGNGVDLHRVNDLTIGSTGAMYFTNHATGNEVFFLDAAGKLKTFTGVATPFVTPNGIEWIEEKKQIYVTLDGPAAVYRYDVNEDGTLKNEKFFAAVKEPDGITVDELGNLYIASYTDGAIMVFDTTGKSLGKITVQSANPAFTGQAGNASNCTIGGPDKKTLYITGNGGSYKVQLKVGSRKRPGASVSLRRPRTGFSPLPAPGFPAHRSPAYRYPEALEAYRIINPAGRTLTATGYSPMPSNVRGTLVWLLPENRDARNPVFAQLPASALDVESDAGQNGSDPEGR